VAGTTGHPGLAATALAAALVLSLLAGPAAGGDPAGGPVRLGPVTVYPPEEVSRFIRADENGACLEFAGCRAWALAGAESLFVPMPVAEVVEAVRQITFPLEGLPIDILILPVPRRDLAESSAEGPVIVLSPGVRGIPQEHVHYTVAHEIGHAVHHLLMPNAGDQMWSRYAAVRSLDLEAARSARRHADRIEEVFAEDFRVLFGGTLARCGGGVENHDLADPLTLPGLREFFCSLRGSWEGRLRLYASPNPFGESVRFRAFGLDGGASVDVVRIYDSRGRLVAVLEAGRCGEGSLAWDGRLEGGLPAAPGVYCAVVTSGAATTAVKVVRASR